jgi:hypothetical protein
MPRLMEIGCARRRMIWNSGTEICDRVFVSAGVLRGVELMLTSQPFLMN